jgi:hypothetical protein
MERDHEAVRRCSKWPTRGPIRWLGSAFGEAVMIRLVKSPGVELDGEECKATYLRYTVERGKKEKRSLTVMLSLC